MSEAAPKATAYTAQEVASLLGLNVSQIRAYVQSGILEPERGPRGQLRFSFQDLVFFRTVKDLSAARVPARRVRDAIRRLRDTLPRDRSLSGVRIAASGRQVVAREGERLWNPDSGQFVFDFDAKLPERDVLQLERQSSEPDGDVEIVADAEDWFQFGCELEDAYPEQAKEAYARAIELEPRHVEAHVNLGSMLHETGDLRQAELHYRAALEVETGNPVAAFDLGVVLEDQGRDRDAEQAYLVALTLEPESPDVHYNLAHLYDRMGQPHASIRHLKVYRRLVQGR